jgi:FlaG/FlaF family flagellin (archaellin)
MKRKKGKKGDATWISWVLLMAFAVVMSAIVYNWMFGFTKSSAESIEKRTMNAAQCEQVGLSIDKACQETEYIYMDVTNRNNLNIDKVIVRMYNVYGEPIEPLLEKTISIGPKESTKIQLQKSGVVKKVDLIPITIQKRTEIVCSERVAQAQDIEFKEACG